MKLFEKDAYTREATEFNRNLIDAVRRVAQPYLAAGASIRETSLLAHHAVTDFECEIILGSQASKKTVQEMAKSLTEN